MAVFYAIYVGFKTWDFSPTYSMSSRLGGSGENGGPLWRALRLNGGVDIEAVDEFHETIEIVFFRHYIACIDKMYQGLHQGHLSFRKYNANVFKLTKWWLPLVCLEQELEKWAGNGQ